MSKVQLHQVLAVESSLNNQGAKILRETIETFGKKAQHFVGQIRRYTTKEENGYEYENEDKIVATTVKDKLRYIQSSIVNAMDVSFQKESTNAIAKADIKIGDELIAGDVPVTFLLNLESRLIDIRTVAGKIPTLDNGIAWINSKENPGCRETHDVVTIKTKKDMKHVIVVPVTKEHPAQTREVTSDIIVGNWKTKKLSGEFSSTEKSELLGRIDKLIIAVKKARATANQQEVIAGKIGSKITGYIFK